MDFISLTDIAHYSDLIRNWLHNRNTLKFMTVWKQLNNPAFNSVEFHGFKKQHSLNIAGT